jgi:hypothetical protein
VRGRAGEGAEIPVLHYLYKIQIQNYQKISTPDVPLPRSRVHCAMYIIITYNSSGAASSAGAGAYYIVARSAYGDSRFSHSHSHSCAGASVFGRAPGPLYLNLTTHMRVRRAAATMTMTMTIDDRWLLVLLVCWLIADSTLSFVHLLCNPSCNERNDCLQKGDCTECFDWPWLSRRLGGKCKWVDAK